MGEPQKKKKALVCICKEKRTCLMQNPEENGSFIPLRAKCIKVSYPPTCRVNTYIEVSVKRWVLADLFAVPCRDIHGRSVSQSSHLESCSSAGSSSSASRCSTKPTVTVEPSPIEILTQVGVGIITKTVCFLVLVTLIGVFWLRS